MKKTVTVAVKLTSTDTNYHDFVKEQNMKQQLSKLLGDLLYYYWKDETAQKNLSDFLVREDEFYGNIAKDFDTIVSQHTGHIEGIKGLTPEQLLTLMVDINKVANMQHIQPPPQTAFIQQFNPAYGTNGLQGVQQGFPADVTPPTQALAYSQQPIQQTIQPTVQQPMAQTIQQSIEQPMVTPPSVSSEPPVPPVQDTYVPKGDAPAGLFADDDDEDEEEVPKKPTNAPASLSRLVSSIRKG